MKNQRQEQIQTQSPPPDLSPLGHHCRRCQQPFFMPILLTLYNTIPPIQTYPGLLTLTSTYTQPYTSRPVLNNSLF